MVWNERDPLEHCERVRDFSIWTLGTACNAYRRVNENKAHKNTNLSLLDGTKVAYLLNQSHFHCEHHQQKNMPGSTGLVGYL